MSALDGETIHITPGWRSTTGISIWTIQACQLWDDTGSSDLGNHFQHRLHKIQICGSHFKETTETELHGSNINRGMPSAWVTTQSLPERQEDASLTAFHNSNSPWGLISLHTHCPHQIIISPEPSPPAPPSARHSCSLHVNHTAYSTAYRSHFSADHTLTKICRFVTVIYSYNYRNSGHYPLSSHILETGFCFGLQVEPTQMAPTESGSVSLQTPPTTPMGYVASPQRDTINIARPLSSETLSWRCQLKDVPSWITIHVGSNLYILIHVPFHGWNC